MISQKMFDSFDNEWGYLVGETITLEDTGESATVVSAEYVDSTRWTEIWTAIIADDNGEFWAVDFQLPATEVQEGSTEPAEYSDLYQVWPHEVTETRYLRKPVEE